MNVLVIWPGHGSEWLTDAVWVDRFGKPNPRGRLVEGSGWEYDGGWNMPDDYIGMPVRVRAPRRWVLRVEHPGGSGMAFTGNVQDAGIDPASLRVVGL